MQKTAFLDSLHTLLLQTLAREFDDYQPPELTESKIEELRAEQLLFYTTAQLEAFDSHKARTALLVIRRRMQFPLMEGIAITQPESYCNVYINYLNTRTDTEFMSELEKMNINSDSLLIKLLRLSKLSHSYEQYKGVGFFMAHDIEGLIKSTLIEINRDLPSYQPVWLYKFLFGFLESRGNSSKAYRALFAKMVNKQDIATNFYLQQIKPTERYQEFHKLLLTLENPYIKNLTNFLNAIKRLSERAAERGEMKRRITLDTELFRMQSEVSALSTHFSALTQFAPLLQNSQNSLEKKIMRRRSEIENHLLHADEKTALSYSASPLLSEERSHLFQLHGSESSNKKKLAEALLLSIRVVPALALALVKRYGEKFGDYPFLHDLLENEEWDSSLQKIKVESFLIENSTELERILPLLERRVTGNSKFVRESFVERRFDRFREEVKLLSLLSNSSEQAKMLSHVKSPNRAMRLAKELGISEGYVHLNFNNLLKQISELSRENLTEIIIIVHHNRVLFRKLMDAMSTYIHRNATNMDPQVTDMSSHYGFVLAQLITKLSDSDVAEDFHNQMMKNFLDSHLKRGSYALEFLITIWGGTTFENCNTTINKLDGEIHGKYCELVNELMAYHYISVLIYPYHDAITVNRVKSFLVDGFIENELIQSRRLKNLGEFLKVLIHIDNAPGFYLDYQDLDNIAFDYTQNISLHKSMQLMDMIIALTKTENILKEGGEFNRNTLDILKDTQCSTVISSVITLEERENPIDKSLCRHILWLLDLLIQSSPEENIEKQSKIARLITPHIYHAITETMIIFSAETIQNKLANLDKGEIEDCVRILYLMRSFLDRYDDQKERILANKIRKDDYYQIQQVMITFDCIGRIDNVDILRNFSKNLKVVCEIDNEGLLITFLNGYFEKLFKFIEQMLDLDRETGIELFTKFVERFKDIKNIDTQEKVFNRIAIEQLPLFKMRGTEELNRQIKEHIDLLSTRKLIKIQIPRETVRTQSSSSSKGNTSKRENPKKAKRRVFN